MAVAGGSTLGEDHRPVAQRAQKVKARAQLEAWAGTWYSVPARP